MCDLLEGVLAKEKNFASVGCATSETDLEATLEMCDVLLAWHELPGVNVLRLIRKLSARHMHLKILIMGIPSVKSTIVSFAEAGAVGYILSCDSIEILVSKIYAAHQGQSLVEPAVAGALMSRLAEISSHVESASNYGERLALLTRREVEVLHLIGQQMTNNQIARQLTIEVGTVKNHVHNILSKLEVHSRRDAAVYLPMLEAPVPQPMQRF